MGATNVNVTIDNVVPLITYGPSGQWREGTAASDPEFSEYVLAAVLPF